MKEKAKGIQEKKAEESNKNEARKGPGKAKLRQNRSREKSESAPGKAGKSRETPKFRKNYEKCVIFCVSRLFPAFPGFVLLYIFWFFPGGFAGANMFF